MIKFCPHCQSDKQETEFYKFYERWSDKYYLSSRCRPCHQDYKRNNPNRSKNNKSFKLKLRYGMTHDEWESMRRNEDYRCMICGISEEQLGRKLDVDHCHTSGKVRGVLCNPCNTVLGHARDNVKVLESAAKYLNTNGGGYKTSK